MTESKLDILFIDTSGMERISEGMVLHPEQLKWANKIQRESFDEVYVFNTPSNMLSAKSFLGLYKLLRPRGKLEVIVAQKILVLQDLDAQEIESNAKLAGFGNIEVENHERFVKLDGKDFKEQSLRITMLK
jgi:hypothetical protein